LGLLLLGTGTRLAQAGFIVHGMDYEGHGKSSGLQGYISSHYYRMDLLSWAVTAFSPGYRVGTTIPGLKVEPSVPGHRAGTKEGPLVPVGNTNRD